MKGHAKIEVTRELVARFQAFHSRNPVPFHCILDDFNFEQGFADSSLRNAADGEERELAEIMAGLSRTQRRKLSRQIW